MRGYPHPTLPKLAESLREIGYSHLAEMLPPTAQHLRQQQDQLIPSKSQQDPSFSGFPWPLLSSSTPTGLHLTSQSQSLLQGNCCCVTFCPVLH